MASFEDKLARMQEIANRGIQDQLSPNKRAIFDEALSRGLITKPQAAQQSIPGQEVSAQGFDNLDVPTDTNLEQQSIAGTQTEASLAEKSIGAAEAIGTIATGATSGALGFALGSLEGVAGDISGRITPEEAEQVAGEYASALTYLPKTKAGQDIVKFIGDKLSALPPVLGATPAPLLAASAPTKQGLKLATSNIADSATTVKQTFGDLLLPVGKASTAANKNNLKNMRMPKDNGVKRKIIAEQTLAGNPNIKAVTKMINESGDIVTNPRSVKALKVLTSELGEESAIEAVSVVENMRRGSKKAFKDMLHIIQEGKDKPLYKQRNRPSDVLGEALAARAKDIKKLNEQSARRIGAIAKNELSKSDINITEVKNRFYDSMADLGVKVTKDKDGKNVFDFSESKFLGGNAEQINRLNTFLKDDSINGFDAHKLKQFARELVDFGEGTDSAIVAGSQAPIKNLAADINSILVNVNPKYAKANKSFSDSIDMVKGFDKMVKSIDLDGDLAGQSLSNKAKRLTSNADTRASIRELFEGAERVLKDSDFKVNYSDDIDAISFALTKLEDSFKLTPPDSFRGNIQRAGANIAQGMGPTTAAGTVATENIMNKVFNLSKPDFNKKMKAYKMLIQEQE